MEMIPSVTIEEFQMDTRPLCEYREFFNWVVNDSVDGHILQKVTLTVGDQISSYWEAFRVKAGEVVSHDGTVPMVISHFCWEIQGPLDESWHILGEYHWCNEGDFEEDQWTKGDHFWFSANANPGGIWLGSHEKTGGISSGRMDLGVGLESSLNSVKRLISESPASTQRALIAKFTGIVNDIVGPVVGPAIYNIVMYESPIVLPNEVTPDQLQLLDTALFDFLTANMLKK